MENAGLGPSAGLETQGSLDGTVCHPYPSDATALILLKLVVTKALLFSTD